MLVGTMFNIWTAIVHPPLYAPLFSLCAEVCAGLLIYLISDNVEED